MEDKSPEEANAAECYAIAYRLVSEAKQLSAREKVDVKVLDRLARMRLNRAEEYLAQISEQKLTTHLRRIIEAFRMNIEDTGEWTREELLGEGGGAPTE